MKILCFGMVGDIIHEDISTKSFATVGELRTYIYDHYEEIRQLNSLLIAVNQEYAEDHQKITSDDEIAIFPPVSGG